MKHGGILSSAAKCAAGPDKWVVVHRNCNYSTFNGRHYTPSAYSALKCQACGHRWRSKGKFVGKVRDATHEQATSGGER